MKRKLLVSAFICLVSQISTTLCAQTFTSSNLPIVVINTYGQSISAYQKYYVGMGIIDNGPGVRNNMTDPFNGFNGEVELDLHGQSTLYLPKQSYGITPVDGAHQSLNVPLLGLPAGKDWVFKGLYQDKTFLRDELGFMIHNRMGHYSSRTRFFELVVDGDYRGVYQIEEKVKRDNDRVNISKLKYTDTTGDELTGGYIIRLDKFYGPTPGWYSFFNSNISHDSANYFLFHYPKPDSMPQVQKDYIEGYFHAFENVLVSPTFNDPVNGYRRYIDVPSFIDNFILNELSKNTDGYRSSTYFYKDRDSKGGKLFSGPMWDFNIAFDNCNFNGGDNPAGWQYQVFATENFVPFWWWQFMSDDSFKDELKCRYQYLRTNVLNITTLYQHIDSMAAFLDESQARNFAKWPIMGQYVAPQPSPIPPDYAGEIGRLKYFIQQRLNWMDANMPGLCQVGVHENELADNMLNVYPNPFSNNMTVAYYLPEGGKLKIELLNLVGERIQLITEGEKSYGEYENVISTETLASGIYLVKMSLNDHVAYKKVVKM
ncbi:MAG: hypothetical protein JWO09_585 [Bacteroidetes bacterium]|nr:hypothetical protein [Bacteroidota bacterium]